MAHTNLELNPERVEARDEALYWTPAQVCRAGGFSEAWLYKQQRLGRGPVWRRFGSRKAIAPADARAWLDALSREIAEERAAAAAARKAKPPLP